MPKTMTGVPVTVRALIQRINRKLKPNDEALKVSRGARARQDLGEFYIVNVNRNFIVATHVSPEAWGRKLGVLADWERVVEE